MTEYLLGKIDEFPEGKGRAFKAGSGPWRYSAPRARCTRSPTAASTRALAVRRRHHQRGTVIRCPWHNWSFELASGKHCLDHRETIRTYEVKMQGDQVILCA